MNKLVQKAAEIKLAEQSNELLKKSSEEQELAAYYAEVVASFEQNFTDILEMLKEAGISYKAARNNPRYPHMGVYIEFEKDNRGLKMDYILNCTQGGAGWRYEHAEPNNRYFQSVYGHWPKEEFITWIAEFFFPEL